MSLEQLLEHTLVAYERVFVDANHLRNVYTLRYEDFVQDPEAELGDLFRYLGLGPCEIREAVNPSINQRYFRMWHQGFVRPRPQPRTDPPV